MVNLYSAKCVGIDAVKVTAEVHIENGIGIHLVGLCDTAVKESLLRTSTALSSIGLHVPGRRIVINLAPADVHKSGSGYDLPIALGVLAASEQIKPDEIGNYLIIGELGLDGSVRPVPGALPVADLAAREGFKGVILPYDSAWECAEMQGVEVYGVRNLLEAIDVIEGNKEAPNEPELFEVDQSAEGALPQEPYPDFADILGQEAAKRAAEIAAAGGHNIAMMGPPGSGKSTLAKAMAGILPPMTHEESVTTSKIYSVAGKGSLRAGLLRARPFRAPHYSASLPAMIGGGQGDYIVPGEISLAQNGVLFLDEFLQMPKSVVEALRAPLEDRKVVISRLRNKVEFPASFMLVAASNPCPCGYYGDGDRCTCTPGQRQQYLSRLSGPILDRIDIHVFMAKVPSGKILNGARCESSAEVAARICRARAVQTQRFAGTGIATNAQMSNKLVEKFCPLSQACKDVMEKLIDNMGLSVRAYIRTIKVARTIADLAESPQILPTHIIEAAGYRFLDKHTTR